MVDASTLMGPLLLKGWAMGADSCDIDMTPLMEDKRNKGKICCQCDHKLAKLICDGCSIVAREFCYYVEN